MPRYTNSAGDGDQGYGTNDGQGLAQGQGHRMHRNERNERNENETYYHGKGEHLLHGQHDMVRLYSCLCFGFG